MTWAEAFAWIEDLNRSRPGGFADWRLPDRHELFSLVSHETVNPALPAGHPFVNVFPGYYWTATTVNRLPDQAWYVHLGGARVVKGMKSGSCMVWPVRSFEAPSVFRTGQTACTAPDGAGGDRAGSGRDCALPVGRPRPLPRFEVQDGVVADRLTGLFWTRAADLVPGPVAWEEANERVAAANRRALYGYADWRLPHIRELESLCDLQRHSPALPAGHPFEAVQDFYWSGTISRYDRAYAWALYLLDGQLGVGYKAGGGFHLWPVRGPQTENGS